MECKNCNEDLVGQEKFCSGCGQKNIDKLNLKYLYGEILDNVLNLDSKLFNTVKGLIMKPGFLSKEFVEGRRKRYVMPVRFYIIISIIFFFMVSIIGTIPDSNPNLEADVAPHTFTINGKDITVLSEKYNELTQTNTLDSYIADSIGMPAGFPHFFVKQSIKAQNTKGGFGGILLNQLSIFLLLFIPFIGLVYQWSFKNNGYSYVEHVVFNVHFNSFVIVLLMLNELFKLFSDEYWVYRILIIFVGSLVYLFASIKKFYERKWWVVLYKLFFLFSGYLSLAFGFGIALVLVSVIML